MISVSFISLVLSEDRFNIPRPLLETTQATYTHTQPSSHAADPTLHALSSAWIFLRTGHHGFIVRRERGHRPHWRQKPSSTWTWPAWHAQLPHFSRRSVENLGYRRVRSTFPYHRVHTRRDLGTEILCDSARWHIFFRCDACWVKELGLWIRRGRILRTPRRP